MAKQYIATTNTKLLLHLDGNSNDSSGNSNNGTDTNITYSAVNAKFGQRAGFAQSSASRIKVADANSLDITGSITISFWAYPTTVDANWRTFLVKGRASGEDQTNYAIRTSNSAGKLQFYYCPVATYQVWTTTNAVLTVNTMHHVLFTYTFGTAASILCYVNGVQKAGSWTSGTGAVSAIANAKGLGIGCKDFDGTPAEKYDGSLDEIIIEDRLWSAQEITNYYNYNNSFFSVM